LRRSCGEGLVIGQKLERAVQPVGSFEIADHAQLAVERRDAARLSDRQRSPLQVIVTQYQGSDFTRHFGEQRLALLGC
jgi:hypothetical protein